MRAVLIAILTILATSAMATPAVKIDTELTEGRCRFIKDDGEVGHYALKRSAPALAARASIPKPRCKPSRSSSSCP